MKFLTSANTKSIAFTYLAFASVSESASDATTNPDEVTFVDELPGYTGKRQPGQMPNAAQRIHSAQQKLSGPGFEGYNYEEIGNDQAIRKYDLLDLAHWPTLQCIFGNDWAKHTMRMTDYTFNKLWKLYTDRYIGYNHTQTGQARKTTVETTRIFSELIREIKGMKLDDDEEDEKFANLIQDLYSGVYNYGLHNLVRQEEEKMMKRYLRDGTQKGQHSLRIEHLVGTHGDGRLISQEQIQSVVVPIYEQFYKGIEGLKQELGYFMAEYAAGYQLFAIRNRTGFEDEKLIKTWYECREKLPTGLRKYWKKNKTNGKYMPKFIGDRCKIEIARKE